MDFLEGTKEKGSRAWVERLTLDFGDIALRVTGGNWKGWLWKELNV